MYSTTKPLLRRLREMLPTFCGIAVTCFALQAHADDYFNPALLDIDNPEQAKTDLSVYEKGPGQAPGKYQVTMFINNNKIDTRDVLFTLQKDARGDDSLQPCLSLDELTHLGIKTKDYPKLAAKGNARISARSLRPRRLSASKTSSYC